MPIDKASQLKQKRIKYGPEETPRRNTPKKHPEETPRRNTPKKHPGETPRKNTSKKHPEKTPRRNTSEKHLGEIVPKKYAEEIRLEEKYALKKNTTLKRKK